jgi:hypothetical protein
MADTPRHVLAPVEQATVALYGRDIIAVRLPDGRIAAVLSTMCEALQIATESQARRIRTDEVLDEHLLLVQVATAGGPQPMDALTAWAIPMWLTGIQIKRLAPEKQPAVLAFKREAADALYRHFSHPPAQLAVPSSLVPAEPIQKPTRPPEGSDPLTMAQYYRDMAAWLEWQADIEQWRGSIESRLESVEEVTRLVPEILERLGPEMLTPAHQHTVQAMAKRLHEVGGFAFATIYADLGAAFHVAKYDQVPEDRWPEVTRWFQMRIEAAERRGKRP